MLNHSSFFYLLILLLPLPVYAEYLFISSDPIGAKVYTLDKEGKKTKKNYIGTTPLKTTNFTQETQILLIKDRHADQTNTIKSSNKIRNEHFILRALSFQILFPHAETATLDVGKKIQLPLEGVLQLPYGSYNFDYENDLIVEYKSPYIPYVAFFTTLTLVSITAAITTGILGQQAYEKYKDATSTEDLLSGLSTIGTMDAIMWSSVAIGTGSLIGMSITAAYEVKDQKRIKRFNGLNLGNTTLNSSVSDFQEIVLLSSRNHPDTLDKMDDFLKKYEAEDTPFIAEIYVKRAGIYILQGKRYRQAINDLKKVIEVYPSLETYEIAHKLLGDIYAIRGEYKDSYKYYQETLKVLNKYQYNDIKMAELEVLYQITIKGTKAQKEEFLLNTENLTSLTRDNRAIVEKWREEFLPTSATPTL